MIISEIKWILIAVLIGLYSYFIYDYGYDRAAKKYSKVIQEYNDRQLVQVQNLESKITSLITATSTYNGSLIKDIDLIKAGISKKPLVVYKEGKCTLSQEFLDSRAAAIDRANKR